MNYINAHATSTLVGDVAEIKAVKSAFPDLSNMKINGTKSMIGHCLGAAGGMEAIATLKAIQTGWVHPTLNQVRCRTQHFSMTEAACSIPQNMLYCAAALSVQQIVSSPCANANWHTYNSSDPCPTLLTSVPQQTPAFHLVPIAFPQAPPLHRLSLRLSHYLCCRLVCAVQSVVSTSIFRHSGFIHVKFIVTQRHV